MIRQSSVLPHALDSSISRSIITYEKTKPNQRYLSSLSRNGPYPADLHKCTDSFCLVIFGCLVALTILLFSINIFSSNLAVQGNFQELNFLQKIIYGIHYCLPQTMLSCVGLILLGILLMLIVLLIPIMVGYFIMFCLLAILAFVLYSLSIMKASQALVTNQNQFQTIRIILMVVAGLAILAFIYLIVSREKKLRHLGALMKVAKTVLMQNMPWLPLLMLIIMNGLTIGLWYLFSVVAWNTIRMNHSPAMPISPILIISLVLTLWVWTIGIFRAISYYLCQSWVLHWYYKSNNSQLAPAGSQQNWKLSVVRNLVRYHLGTCIYGSLLIFISEFFLSPVRRCFEQKTSNGQSTQRHAYYSNYCYIFTIMESLSFCQANQFMAQFRSRVRESIPQAFMLGRLIQKIIIVSLSISALILWLFLSYSYHKFVESNLLLEFSQPLFLLMCLCIILGIFYSVSLNISHLFGVVSDTAIMAYKIDSETERVYYHQNFSNSTPKQLLQPFKDLQISSKLVNQSIFVSPVKIASPPIIITNPSVIRTVTYPTQVVTSHIPSMLVKM